MHAMDILGQYQYPIYAEVVTSLIYKCKLQSSLHIQGSSRWGHANLWRKKYYILLVKQVGYFNMLYREQNSYRELQSHCIIQLMGLDGKNDKLKINSK